MISRPVAGEEALPGWLRKGWQRGVLALGLLVFLLAFTAAWAVAAVFALIVLWRHGGNHPVVALFLGGWLLAWMSYPVALILGIRRGIAIRKGRPWQMPGVSLSRWSAGLFPVGFAVAWCAALAGLLRQGDVGGFVLGSAVATVVVLVVIVDKLYRQVVSVDELALEVRNTYGPFERTRRYELQLISAVRAEREADPEGGFTRFWEVAFEYGSKTVRFGCRLSQQEAEQRALELSRLI